MNAQIHYCWVETQVWLWSTWQIHRSIHPHVLLPQPTPEKAPCCSRRCKQPVYPMTKGGKSSPSQAAVKSSHPCLSCGNCGTCPCVKMLRIFSFIDGICIHVSVAPHNPLGSKQNTQICYSSVQAYIKDEGRIFIPSRQHLAAKICLLMLDARRLWLFQHFLMTNSLLKKINFFFFLNAQASWYHQMAFWNRSRMWFRSTVNCLQWHKQGLTWAQAVGGKLCKRPLPYAITPSRLGLLFESIQKTDHAETAKQAWMKVGISLCGYFHLHDHQFLKII